MSKPILETSTPNSDPCFQSEKDLGLGWLNKKAGRVQPGLHAWMALYYATRTMTLSARMNVSPVPNLSSISPLSPGLHSAYPPATSWAM